MSFELKATSLECIRGNRVLFQNVDFSLNAGELLQIVGENGAGKSTLLKIISGVFRNYRGSVFWNNQSIHENLEAYHSELFYLGHQQTVKNDLTVFENIYFDFNSKRNSKDKIMAALHLMGLDQHSFQLAGQLSQGQRQRVALSKLLLSEARLWILDEPFSALDALGKEKVEAIFQDKIDQGNSVVFTSHQSLHFADFPIKVLIL